MSITVKVKMQFWFWFFHGCHMLYTARDNDDKKKKHFFSPGINLMMKSDSFAYNVVAVPELDWIRLFCARRKKKYEIGKLVKNNDSVFDADPLPNEKIFFHQSEMRFSHLFFWWPRKQKNFISILIGFGFFSIYFSLSVSLYTQWKIFETITTTLRIDTSKKNATLFGFDSMMKNGFFFLVFISAIIIITRQQQQQMCV